MALKLSICISTFNRARFIGATLDSIIHQATDDCEIVVLDCSPADDTEPVVLDRARRFDRLRYVRKRTNDGIDRDFDHAVGLARGEYCWLFSDDDLLMPHAISAVLEALRGGYSLVLVNGEHRTFDMSQVCIPSFFGFDTNRVYGVTDMNRLFTEVGTCLICICCVIIKRELWMTRQRAQFYGSMFIHVGVIFQEELPRETLVMAKPLMSLRLGNEQTHTKEGFLVWNINWPSLVWSLPLSSATKNRFCVAQPWRRPEYLLGLRATGRYSASEYRRWIRPRLHVLRERLLPTLVTLLPRRLAYYLFILYALLAGGPRAPREVGSTMLPKSWNEFKNPPLARRAGRSGRDRP